MDVKRCVSWVAVSSEEQAKRASPDVQRVANRRFVEETLPVTYGVRGELVIELELADTRSIIELSEAAATYPESYGVLYELLRQKERAFDVLVCRSADRLGRTRTLISTIEELCEAQGVVIVCVAEGLPASLDARQREGSSYGAANRGAAAKEEIIRLKNRRDIGMRETRLGLKKLFPGKAPFGYAYKMRLTDDGPVQDIIVVPEEAATVRRLLVDLYLGEGLGTQAIAARLNEEKRQAARGGSWTFGTVGTVLERVKRYAGWIEFNKDAQTGKEHVTVRGNYQQIITDAELAAITAERTERAKRPVRRRHALTGVVFCDECGKQLTYHSFERKGEPVQTLRCARSYCTKRVEVRLYLVHEALRAFVEEVRALYHTNTLRAFVAASAQDPAGIDRQIAQAELTRKRLAESRRRTVRAYTDLQAIEEEEFVRRLRDVDGRLAAVDAELDRLQDQRAGIAETESRVARAEEVAERGLSMVEKMDSDPAAANVWFRRHVRVWVKPGSRYAERIRLVELV
jgi:DNA invertase Pin-like site-specific DNA recombinase